MVGGALSFLPSPSHCSEIWGFILSLRVASWLEYQVGQAAFYVQSWKNSLNFSLEQSEMTIGGWSLQYVRTVPLG